MNHTMKIRPIAILLLFALLLILFTGITLGLAGLDIPWWSIDGGGGQSSGGNFVLNSSIGQADVGAMSGGSFSLESGFFSSLGLIQSIGLQSGWNMISSYIDPSPDAFSTIFPDAYDDTLLCKNGLGQVYWPSMGVTNQLTTWNAGDGYQCYTNAGFPISLTGTLIEAEQPMNLVQGWNLTAYWRNVPIAAPTALADCSSELLLAKNGDGEIYWPDYSINDIGDMQPGEGYQLYLTSGCVLSYPEN